MNLESTPYTPRLQSLGKDPERRILDQRSGYPTQPDRRILAEQLALPQVLTDPFTPGNHRSGRRVGRNRQRSYAQGMWKSGRGIAKAVGEIPDSTAGFHRQPSRYSPVMNKSEHEPRSGK